MTDFILVKRTHTYACSHVCMGAYENIFPVFIQMVSNSKLASSNRIFKSFNCKFTHSVCIRCILQYAHTSLIIALVFNFIKASVVN